MPPHAQELYAQAQDLKHRGEQFPRRSLFLLLGGTLFEPEPVTGYPDENCWYASLHGRTKFAETCDTAILKWAEAVLRLPCAAQRATDGRPDCPYNGAGLAPPSPATPAA